MNNNKFTAVMIIPTGLGAEIGGHAGDANATAKLIAQACDTLILHPNVVNASDINELTYNSLYVEGSILDRFLEGKIKLKPVKSNKILCVANAPLGNETINAVSAARITLGAEIEMLVLDKPLKMIAKFEDGKATGDIINWEELVEQVQEYDFDALAITSVIDVSKEVAFSYLNNKKCQPSVNPWGGVEAKTSKLIANSLNKPVAHAPVDSGLFEEYNEVVDPRMSAEMVSVCYLHCVLKGLHKAPRISLTEGISNKYVDCLITPANMVGRPHKACMKAGIPIIAVKENKTVLNDPMPESFIVVENYLEAVGAMKALEAGVTIESVRRPFKYTKVHNLEKSKEVERLEEELEKDEQEEKN